MSNTDIISSIPVVSGVDQFRDPRLFVEKFGKLSDSEWSAALLQSAKGNEVGGIALPRFPDQETQRRIHGATNPETSIREAMEFYSFVRQFAVTQVTSNRAKLLDYGSGWGRISRPFLKDVPYDRIFSYEPNLGFCVLQRILNPYITVIHGSFLPDGILPAGQFSLIVGWSIFSHLSEEYAVAWFKEFERILQPGGACVLTTWGRRFLNRLLRDQEALARGKEVDWYSQICIKAMGGDVGMAIHSYENGDFVWFGSTATGYGEAFVSKASLSRILDRHKIGLTLEAFDDERLSQDCFVLKKPLA